MVKRFEEFGSMNFNRFPLREKEDLQRSVSMFASLGTHTFELVLDINGNLTEAREDNNVAYANLTVVEPYAVSIQSPETVQESNRYY